MFSANFQNLLDPLEHEVPQSVGNTRKIGRGVRINTNDSARLDIAWCVRQSADYATYGRDGRFVEFRIADVENVTRKTLSLIDSRPPSTGENHHFLYVARAERPTKVLVSVAGRCDPDAKFADLSRTNQAIGEVPTALMVTVRRRVTQHLRCPIAIIDSTSPVKNLVRSSFSFSTSDIASREPIGEFLEVTVEGRIGSDVEDH